MDAQSDSRSDRQEKHQLTNIVSIVYSTEMEEMWQEFKRRVELNKNGQFDDIASDR